MKIERPPSQKKLRESRHSHKLLDVAIETELKPGGGDFIEEDTAATT
jgi:hypothetical protein